MKHITSILLAAFLASCATDERGTQKQHETIPASSDAQFAEDLAAFARPSSATLSMSASRWDIRYSINMPSHPTQSGSGWYFDWKKDVSEVDYLTCKHTARIIGSSLMMTGIIEAAPEVVFDFLTEPGNFAGGIPPSCRFMIQKDLTTENGRWFSAPYCVELKPGIFTLTVALNPGNWTNVYGKGGNYSDATRAGFYKALASPQAIGIVFGGGIFYSHGIRVHNGTARFRMAAFSIQ